MSRKAKLLYWIVALFLIVPIYVFTYIAPISRTIPTVQADTSAVTAYAQLSNVSLGLLGRPRAIRWVSDNFDRTFVTWISSTAVKLTYVDHLLTDFEPNYPTGYSVFTTTKDLHNTPSMHIIQNGAHAGKMLLFSRGNKQSKRSTYAVDDESWTISGWESAVSLPYDSVSNYYQPIELDNGDIYVFFTGDDGHSSDGRHRVQYSKYNASADSWGAAVDVVYIPPESGDDHHAQPMVVATDGSSVHIAVTDYWAHGVVPQYWSIYSMYCPDMENDPTSWRTMSDATEIDLDSAPAGVSDMDEVDTETGDAGCAAKDIAIDDSGNPHIVYTKVVQSGGTPYNGDVKYAYYDSGWQTEAIATTQAYDGGSYIPNAYNGGGCIDPYDVTKFYVAEVEGSYTEINEYVWDGDSFSKTQDITTSSGAWQADPSVVRNYSPQFKLTWFNVRTFDQPDTWNSEIIASYDGAARVQLRQGTYDSVAITAISYFANNGANNPAGYTGLYSSPLHSMMLFKPICIPDGSTIYEAYLLLEGSGETATTTSTRIYADDSSATPTAPTSYATFMGKTLSSNYENWDITAAAWNLSGWNESPDLVDIIQELVDSYDYDNQCSGIQMTWRNNGETSNDYKQATSYDSSSALSPVLYIRWTPVLDISVTPTSYGFGTLHANNTGNTGYDYFTVTNNGSATIDITISGTDMTGTGVTWDLADSGSPDDATYALWAGTWDIPTAGYVIISRVSDPYDYPIVARGSPFSYDSYEVSQDGIGYETVVRETETYNYLTESLISTGTYTFGLKLYSPTENLGSVLMTGTVTLTAAVAT